VKTVGIFDAKTHFSALIGDVESGETITITRRGEPIARITPIDVSQDKAAAARRAIETILSTHFTLGGISIRELIDEGRH